MRKSNPPWLRNIPTELSHSLEIAVADGIYETLSAMPCEFVLEEAKYLAATFSEPGHANYEWLHESDLQGQIVAKRELQRLKRYIKRHEKEGNG